MKRIVKLFAQASDLVGSPEIELQMTKAQTVAQFRQALAEQYPQLAPISAQLFVAINNEYARDSDTVPEAAEVACFPPVSGG